jgi:dienelactone hydrolase
MPASRFRAYGDHLSPGRGPGAARTGRAVRGPTTPAQSLWLSVPGGALVYAAVVGTGPATAVFVHQAGPRGLCGFWPYADWLARTKGVHSLLFSQCGAGASQCPAGNQADQWLEVTTAAVTWARTNGAGQVALVGASAGGVVALQVAASIRPPVAAVVDLPGERRWQGLDSLVAARRLGVPALFAVAPGDGYVSVGTMRRLSQAAPVRVKRLVVGRGRGPWLGVARGHRWVRLAAAGRDGGGMDPGPPTAKPRRLGLNWECPASAEPWRPSAETDLSSIA